MLGVNPVTVYDVSSTVTDCIGVVPSVHITIYLSVDWFSVFHCTTNDISVMFSLGNAMAGGVTVNHTYISILHNLR